MGGFNRDHHNGQAIYQKFSAAWSKDKYSEVFHHGATRMLVNEVGGGAILQGPNQGNIPMSTGGGLVIGQETNPDNNMGQRSAGYGRRWERLHLIGVSAGHLQKRDYSNYNTVMGTHGLNSAMIPFEGVVAWVISEQRKYIYSVKVFTKILQLEKMANSKHIEWTRTDVAYSIAQSISYTSSNDDSIWINLCQENTCQIVSKFTANEQIPYATDIPDNWKLSTANEQQIYADIERINAIIINIQNKQSPLNNEWARQNSIGKAL